MVNNYMFKMFLGDNVADDSVTRETIYGTKYNEKLNTDKAAWAEIAKTAVEFGYKSVLIELADGAFYFHHIDFVFFDGAFDLRFQFLHGCIGHVSGNLTDNTAAGQKRHTQRQNQQNCCDTDFHKRYSFRGFFSVFSHSQTTLSIETSRRSKVNWAC